MDPNPGLTRIYWVSGSVGSGSREGLNCLKSPEGRLRFYIYFFIFILFGHDKLGSESDQLTTGIPVFFVFFYWDLT